MDIEIIIVFSLAILVFLGIGIYYILRFMKGSLKINLNKKSFCSNDCISGLVELKAKKEIQSNRLYVSLIAQRRERRYSSNGKTNYRWINVYTQEKEIESSKNYTAGFSNKYNFELKVPFKSEVEGSLNVENEVLKTIVKVASALSNTGRLRWKLECRLDAEGVDLYSKKNISVSLSNKSEDLIQN